MNKLQLQFQQHFAREYTIANLQQDHFLIAISGGIDSIVLAHLMKFSGSNIQLAHCNFQLRGEESIRDEDFVRSFAKKFEIQIHVIRFNTAQYATDNKLSIQEAARKLRYQWFASLRHEFSIKWLLTAHHADDNIETVLMHFFRGTGLKGLTGIPSLQKEQQIIRPLLSFHKAELTDYANENNLSYVEDSSNKKDDYTRNMFRLNILPQIKQIYPMAEDNIIQNIQRLKDANMLYESGIENYKKKLLVLKGKEVHIPVLLLQKAIPLNAIVWEIIKNFGFHAAQTDEAIKLLAAKTGSFIISPSHRIILNRNWLLITPNSSEESVHIQILEGNDKIKLFNGELKIAKIDIDEHFTIPTNANIACINVEEIQFPLLLRPWKQGDYFYPLGMSKKKKLSKYFIDQKLSLLDKEQILVLESMGRIVWIVGNRIDNRFKIKPTTKTGLKIQYTQIN